MKSLPYLIVGAGITGLSLALSLQEQGKEFLLLEARDQAGGNIRSHSEEGFTYDLGPNTLLVRDPLVAELLHNLSLAGIAANPIARRRFVLNRQNRLVALGPGALLGGKLLSLRARLHLLGEPFRARAHSEESVATFVRRRLGSEVLDWMVDPFVSGVFAGDPERLSLSASLPRLAQMEQEHGSLMLAGLRRKRPAVKSRLLSFPGGMQALPRACAAKLGDKLRCNSAVTAIAPTANGWQVESTTGTWETQKLILCLPTDAIARILPSAAQLLRDRLAAIEYPSVATLALGFHRRHVQHPLDGFGVLIPRRLGISTLGALFSSTLFPNRAPEGQVLLTIFLGGAREPLSGEEALVPQALHDLSPILGIEGEPSFQRVQIWSRAIPQYNLGHAQRINAIDNALRDWPGLSLLGNWRGGVALGDCIRNGITAGQS
ncbi:protoporphyrinogen oxidase [Acidithiobacillus sp. IBUN Pt1247-S3]|uniref:protoporphyrinogen oxidase n=1 Tax=Acidithiobacillus sp. IBUN Pt1247-S3 TaxID=3166642 RepID=UPI0034E5318A